jgi:hypothetical protein
MKIDEIAGTDKKWPGMRRKNLYFAPCDFILSDIIFPYG